MFYPEKRHSCLLVASPLQPMPTEPTRPLWIHESRAIRCALPGATSNLHRTNSTRYHHRRRYCCRCCCRGSVHWISMLHLFHACMCLATVMLAVATLPSWTSFHWQQRSPLHVVVWHWWFPQNGATRRHLHCHCCCRHGWGGREACVTAVGEKATLAEAQECAGGSPR